MQKVSLSRCDGVEVMNKVFKPRSRLTSILHSGRNDLIHLMVSRALPSQSSSSDRFDEGSVNRRIQRETTSPGVN